MQEMAGGPSPSARQPAQIGLDDVVVVDSDGSKLVAVRRIDIDLDSVAGRELAMADNRTSEVGLEWDTEALEALQQEGVYRERLRSLDAGYIIDMSNMYSFFCGDTLIGYSDLAGIDPHMGMVGGDFRPASGYAILEPLCQEFASLISTPDCSDPESKSKVKARIAEIQAEWEALDLRVCAPDGRSIKFEWIDMQDYAHELDDDTARIVTVHIDDADTWDEFFQPRLDAREKT